MLWSNSALNYAFLSGYTNAKVTADMTLYYSLGFRKIRISYAHYNTTTPTGLQQIKDAITIAKGIGFTVMTGVASDNNGGPSLNQASYLLFQAYRTTHAQWCRDNGVDIFEVGNETERDILYSATGTITQTGNVVTVPMTGHPFNTGDLIYATGMTPTDYNTPLYVSPSTKGGAVCTKIDANSFSYPISNNPVSPATGGFIRFSNIGRLEIENLLLADAATLRTNGDFTRSISYSFNDTYLPDWRAIGVSGITALDFLGFHKYKGLSAFKTDVQSFLSTFGASGKAMITEWGADNGRNDFKTANAFNSSWNKIWEIDTYQRLQALKALTATYAASCPCYFYSVNEGQQIWSLHNTDGSYNYPFAVIAGTRRAFV